MYFMKKKTIIYRDFGSFGYITDNRNFGYRLLNDTREFVGDKIISPSGAVFYSVLMTRPLAIEQLVDKLMVIYEGVDKSELYNDATEFYEQLEKDGFIVGGKTPEECYEKDIRFSYKDTVDSHDFTKRCSEQQPDTKTQDYLNEFFGDKQQLTSVHIEITSKCNERCIHCYIPHELKTNVMTSEMFNNIIEQAKDLKVLHLTISGGEPMAHPEFISFLKKCHEYNFSVNILSNLTMLSDDIINEIKKNDLIGIQTSIYSMNPDIHDEITQNKGSLHKTLEAVAQLIENDIPIQISCPVMQPNKDCYMDVVNWGNSHNIRVNSDFLIIGQYNNKNENTKCRLSLCDVRQHIKNRMQMDDEYMKLVGKEIEKKKQRHRNDFVCSVCNSSICISENGNVYPCVGWQECVLGNLEEDTLRDIWNQSDKIRLLRELRWRDFPKCLNCPQQEFCTMCMVRNANENPDGNPLEVNPYFCEVARITKEMYLSER